MTRQDINSPHPRRKQRPPLDNPTTKEPTSISMNQFQGPSLLEYARFHRIANPTAIDPLEYVDQTYQTNSPFSHENISITHASIEQGLRRGKLGMSKSDARFLSTVIQNARAEHAEVNWDDCLPSVRRMEGLKVELPALTSHHETDMASLRKHTFFGQSGVAPSPLQGCSSYPMADRSDALKMSSRILDKTKMEKFSCTKGSLIMIQSARRCGDGCAKYIEPCFDTVLQPYQRTSREPDPPIGPIVFDDLHSPSPTPQLQMPPSPVSSGFEQCELQCLPKAEASVLRPVNPDNIVQSSIPRPLKFNNSRSPIIQVEEELGLPDEWHPSLIEQQYQRYVSVETGSKSEEVIDTGKVDALHRLDFPNDPVQFVHSTIQEEETSSEVEITFQPNPTAHCQPESSLATLQPTHTCSPRDTADIGGPDSRLGHPGERQAHSQGTTGYFTLPIKTPIGSTDPNATKQKNEGHHILDNDSYPETNSVPQPSIVIEEKVLCEASAGPAGQPSNHQQKRKSAKRDPIPKKKPRRPEKKGTTTVARAVDKDLSSSFTALGSLSLFMETRGKPTKQLNAKSPYFTDNNQSNDNQINHQSPVAETPSEPPIEPEKEKEEINIASAAASHHAPQSPRDNQKPPIILLSTSLLKSHRRLVRILECTKRPAPTLIYRDYDKELPRATANKSIIHGLKHEADIIISPSTGILLTTSQATTQLYLPGHRPGHPQFDGIKGINSPLRERIVLLAPRYERLYLFICHSGETARKQLLGKSTSPGPTADKRTLTSITSLVAFCNAASGYSAIIPLMITPSMPDTAAEWILSLAYKHSFELPESQSSVDMRMSRSTGFTPVNLNYNSKAKLDPESMETETKWELFLRRAGLNPFAAHVILSVLRREEDEVRAGLRLKGDASFNPEITKIPALSRFIEMSTEHRRRLFADLVGDRMLGRIEAMVDNDWQCDWALDFDAFRDAM